MLLWIQLYDFEYKIFFLIINYCKSEELYVNFELYYLFFDNN